MFNIPQELKKLPQKPGVYLFKDKSDHIIYVGKSINLRNRVRSYFHASTQHLKTKMLSLQITSFEYIVTNNEVEALILENNLIKAHKPRYNIALKDDKTYPYIKITDEMYPRVIQVRQVTKDKGIYFGPYSGFALSNTLAIIHSIWPLRTSKKIFPRDLHKTRPCLNYHIGKCKAPCIQGISVEDYDAMISQIVEFLNSKYEDLIKLLTAQMTKAAQEENFELAAILRDRIGSIKNLDQKQNMENIGANDQDVIALAKENDDALVQIFFIRGGKMTGRESIMLEGVDLHTHGEVLTAFVKQFYSDTSFVPREIVLEEEISDKEAIGQWLKSIRGHGVKIFVPKRGSKHNLVQLAAKNARLTLDQFGQEIKRQKERTLGAANEIAALLGLSHINRIEAYDISNIQGYESVGSMVVFENGRPKSSDYRKFKIKTVTGPNDYASIQEVLERRFKRYLEKNDQHFAQLPDVIFIDGGKGHVNAAAEILNKLGINIPLCGIVKDDYHKTRGLIYEDKEVAMGKTSDAFRLVAKIGEEVHRFAVEYHRKLRKKTTLHSQLDEIEGIGATRKNGLFKKFGSIEGIRKATEEELAAAPGMNRGSAKAVYEYFRGTS